MPIRTIAAVAIALLAGTTLALAVTKDEAVTMVKKAVATIKNQGIEKTYAAINTPNSRFVDGEIYIVVQGFNGVTLAHATNPKLIGKNLANDLDVDGKPFSKDLGELGKTQAAFWYDFKFVNPATKKIQVKDLYCESLNQTIVCTGVYRL